jgi:plastocyanin
MKRTGQFAAFAGSVALGLALGACGGDSENADVSKGDDCKTVTVEIPEFAFDPEAVEVATCDSIVWKNVHDQAHTSSGDGDNTWATGNIGPGEESQPVKFDDPGTSTYACSFHPFMKGEVTVT